MSQSELQYLDNLIKKCQNVSSNSERQKLFKQHGSEIKSLICLIYDPFQKFHVTSSNILKYEKKMIEKISEKVENLQKMNLNSCSLSEFLKLLSENIVSGHEALDVCMVYLDYNKDYRETILKAIDKDLKIRVGVSMVNKAFPFLVPCFSLALSLPLEQNIKFFEEQRDKWRISRKLDGCRTIWICENGVATAFSRSGHIYPSHIEGLSFFANAFKDINGVLDGEMGVLDEKGVEYFNIANSLMNPNATVIRGKNTMKLAPNQFLCYFAFDFIPLKTFKAGEGDPIWTERQILLSNTLNPIINSIYPNDTKNTDDKKNTQQIRILDQHPSTQYDSMWKNAEDLGWEGLMLRLQDSKYEGKKTRKMLKRKRQDDEEFEIVEATASMQMPPNSTDSVLALEHVGIDYKGQRVWVGSGFTWEQRLEFVKDLNKLKGVQVTVKHYGETRDKNGGYSLRHPTIKTLWLDDTNNKCDRDH